MPAPTRSMRTLSLLENEHADLREAFYELQQKFLNLSQLLAERDYGEDRVAAALQAILRAPDGVRSNIVAQLHPYGALIAWHTEGLH
jgi:hypothetical protein